VTIMRIVFALLLFGHASVHAVMWTLPFTDAATELPFEPGTSWLLGDQRLLALVLAGLATAGFALVGVGYLLHAAWWPAALLAAGGVSLVLMILFFVPWWAVGIVISGALVVAAVRAGAQA
jgi:hypothetical protein